MKYRKDGRVYRLVPFRGCTECAFFDQECENLPPCNYEGEPDKQTMWRETLFSKIRNWRRR